MVLRAFHLKVLAVFGFTGVKRNLAVKVAQQPFERPDVGGIPAASARQQRKKGILWQPDRIQHKGVRGFLRTQGFTTFGDDA